MSEQDVRKEVNDLRSAVGFFQAPASLIRENDSVVVALKPDFIVVSGFKLYLTGISHNLTAEQSAKICPKCKDKSSSGFVAEVKEHWKLGKCHAFQCDTCKLIYVFNQKLNK